MKRTFRRWAKEDDAAAAIEAGLMLPIMIAVLLGVVDVGMALTVNQKVISASHMVSDLLTRETAKAMSERGPRARCVEFQGVGHAPTLVVPDQVAAVVGFLEQA